ncbi:MAG: hypothetical protein PUH47_07710 [Clostridium sp.]|nr:hypothetical protein [Clostridium sp.]MDY5507612.1 hypothetical protein [Eubacteriales bacterium]
MYDWQKEYKLVQHTPLIHFQHSEPHACLRATEVKPKLDRFLIEQLEKDDRFGDGRWKKWFVGDGSQQSFDYMMRITPNSEQVDRTQSIERAIARAEHRPPNASLHEIHKNYFGNMASGNNIQDTIRETFKESLFYKDGLTLTIRCFIPELLTFIDEHIRGFFMMHNFGTRQRKGFGSFTVDISTKPNEPKGFDLVGKYCPNAYYCKLDNDVNADALLDAVWVISAFLRSGFNRGEGNYVRGFVFRYFQREKNPLANDKAFVKQQVLRNVYNEATRGEHLHPYGNNVRYRYVRGLLGTNENSRFCRAPNAHTPVYDIYTHSAEGIERFPSPLLFKPIGKFVFILPQKMPDEIFGSEFYILEKNQEEKYDSKATSEQKLNYLQTECKSGMIKTPTAEELAPGANSGDEALKMFLDAFAKDFNDKTSDKGGGYGIVDLTSRDVFPAKYLWLRPVLRT